MILMSGVPFSSIILSRYCALVIVFISSPAFKSRKFFISWNHFDVLIILSANSICKRPLSKTQNILFFESGYYVKAIRIFGTILGLKNGVSFSRFLYRGTMAPYVYNFSLWWEISLDTGCTDCPPQLYGFAIVPLPQRGITTKINKKQAQTHWNNYSVYPDLPLKLRGWCPCLSLTCI